MCNIFVENDTPGHMYTCVENDIYCAPSIYKSSQLYYRRMIILICIAIPQVARIQTSN